MQLPKSGIVIRTSGNQVCRIGTESTIPDPPLMASECAFQFEWLGSLVIWLYLTRNRVHGFEVLDFPDLGSVVGGAGCEMLDIGGKEDAGYVVLVCGEMGDRD